MGLLNNTTKLWPWEIQPSSSSILDRNIGSFYNIALGHNLGPENAEVPPTAHLRSLPNAPRGQTITQLCVTQEVHKLMVNKPAQSWVYRLNKITACSFYRQAEAHKHHPFSNRFPPPHLASQLSFVQPLCITTGCYWITTKTFLFRALCWTTTKTFFFWALCWTTKTFFWAFWVTCECCPCIVY